MILVNARVAMATRLELRGWVKDGPAAETDAAIEAIEISFSRAYALVDEIEDALTEYRESSPVHRLNHAGASEWIPANEHLAGVFAESVRFSVATGGAFDPGFRGDRAIPLAERFEWKREGGTLFVRRRDPAYTLGFGAIGKGYAVDRVAAILGKELERGVRAPIPFAINFGGSSLYFSESAYGTPLGAIGWGWDRDEDGDVAGAELVPLRPGAKAVAVSGTLEKGDHIARIGDRARQGSVDGDTRLPIGERELSVFASGASALACDAFTTALFVAGWELGYPFKSAFDSIADCASMGNDGIAKWDRAFQENWAAPFISGVGQND